MIRFGIVGAGSIAHKFAEDIKGTKKATITAVSSRSKEKAEAFAKRFEIEQAVEGYDTLAKSNLVDAVYIATPHPFHKEQTLLFLNNNKHVLCEKPVSVNEDEFIEMRNTAKENNVLLMEAMWTRFLPSTKKIKDIVESEKYGKLKHLYFEFGYPLIDDVNEKNRLLNPDLAGGSLLDIGVYPISFLLHLVRDQIKTLKTDATFHKTGVDTYVRMEITFESGVTATLKSSINQDLNAPGVINFEKGTMSIEDFSRSNHFQVNDKTYNEPFIKGGFTHQIIDFVKTVEQNKIENPIMTHKESQRVMAFMDRVRKQIGLTYPFE
ncbi:MAG: Gfo/Idh/MocA family oxidoreductase [Candidatus Izimaplasma sp.]|nr:Gfo/Idh/MocA family oxidoreductase [Candidatus Izimaplasma bacterium]